MELILVNEKTSSLHGGYDFGNLAGKPKAQVIDLEIPTRVIIPIKMIQEEGVQPVIEIGQQVKAGQVIGRDEQGFYNPVHASINGIVRDIKEVKYNGKAVQVVEIEGDGTKDWQKPTGYRKDWEGLSVEELNKLLYNTGVNGLGKRGPEEVENIIIDGVEDQPLNLSLSILSIEKTLKQFIDGLKILNKISSRAKIHLAFNCKRKTVLQQIEWLVKGFGWIEINPIAPKYPQSREEVLVSTIIGGNNSVDSTGTIILSIQDILRVSEAVVDGKPLIEAFIGLAGTGWEDNHYLRVRNGTPLKDITEHFLRENSRIIPDNIMSNVSINDFEYPVDWRINTLIALQENREREPFSFFRLGARKHSYSNAYLSALNQGIKDCDTNLHGEISPCIFCNYCQEVCPVGIIPHLLDKYVTRGLINPELARYGVFKCLECNLCDFVCPSKIPLTDHIIEGKQKLREELNE